MDGRPLVFSPTDFPSGTAIHDCAYEITFQQAARIRTTKCHLRGRPLGSGAGAFCGEWTPECRLENSFFLNSPTPVTKVRRYGDIDPAGATFPGRLTSLSCC